MESECKLCGEQDRLCRSHIIPEGAHRPVYDRNPRAAIFVHSESGRRRKVQVGVRERLFCSNCEKFFNRIEEPFLTFWRSRDRFPEILDKPYIEIAGIDYENSKKFLLSVLWRAHVAAGEIFSAVDLGPHAEKILRLVQGDSENQDPYPTYSFVLRDPDTGGLADRCVVTPARKRTSGQLNYEMAFLGCAWKIFVSSSAPPLPESCLLKKCGTIVMPVVNYSEFPTIRRIPWAAKAGGRTAK